MECDQNLEPPSQPSDENCNITMKPAGEASSGDQIDRPIKSVTDRETNNVQNNNVNGALSDGIANVNTTYDSSLNGSAEVFDPVMPAVIETSPSCSANSDKPDESETTEPNLEGVDTNEYNDFFAAYGEAEAEGYSDMMAGNGNYTTLLQKSYSNPDMLYDCIDITADCAATCNLLNYESDNRQFESHTEEGQEEREATDSITHLDDLVVRSLSGSGKVPSIGGVYYDNEAADGEAMSEYNEDDLSETDPVYEEDYPEESRDDVPREALYPGSPEEYTEGQVEVSKTGYDREGKPVFTPDTINVVCDGMSVMQLEDDETVPAEPDTLDSTLGSQGEDTSLMQQLQDAMVEDRGRDIKEVLTEMVPDLRADEANWMRLYELLEKHHQQQLLYQCEQHERRVNQIRNQIQSEIHIQQDSLQRRLTSHQKALQTDLTSSTFPFESPTRHSVIGQISPSKLATPTLDKYESQALPIHPEESYTVEIEAEPNYGEVPYGRAVERRETSEKPKDRTEKPNPFSKIDLETPVMKALRYSQLGTKVKDSGYQGSPKTKSIFKSTGTRLSDASDFVSPPYMYSKRTSLEGDMKKGPVQSFFDPPKVQTVGRVQMEPAYPGEILQNILSDLDEYYDLPEKKQLLKEATMPRSNGSPDATDDMIPTVDMVDNNSDDERNLDEHRERLGDEPISPRPPSAQAGESPVAPDGEVLSNYEGFLHQFHSSPSHDVDASPVEGGEEAAADQSQLSTLHDVKSPSFRDELEGGVEAAAETSQLSYLRMETEAEEDGASVSSSVRLHLIDKHARHLSDLQAFYEAELADLKDQLDALKEMSHHGGNYEKEIEDKCKLLEERNVVLKRRCDGLEQKVDELQRENHDKQREIWQYEYKVDTWERKYNHAMIQNEALQAMAEKLNKLKDRDTEILALESDKRRLAASLEESQKLFDDYEELRREKRLLQSQLNTLENELYESRTDNATLKGQVSKLELERKRLSRECQTVRRRSVQQSGSSRIFGSLPEIEVASELPSAPPSIVSDHPPPHNVGETERFYQSVLGGSYKTDYHCHPSQHSPSPLLRADQQIQRLKQVAEMQQASRTTQPESNTLQVPKASTSRITPTNVSPPTKDSSAVNAPHVKPKRRISLGKSPRRSLGAEFEMSNLFTQHAEVLKEKYEERLAEENGRDVGEETRKPTSVSTNHNNHSSTKTGPQSCEDQVFSNGATNGDHDGDDSSSTASGTQSSMKSLFSDSIEETVKNISQLEKRFDKLQMDKRQLETALSHTRTKGPNQGRERERLESCLDAIDKELGSIRMHLKKYHVL